MDASAQQKHIPVWNDVREQLRGLLGEAFVRWFAPITANVEKAEDGILLLHVFAPDKFQRDWIRDNYGTTVEAIWRGIAPEGKVRFAVEHEQTQTPEQGKLPAKVIQLDFWEDDKRAAPNAVFRSALFPALNTKQKRGFLKEEKIYSVRGIDVFFTGERFDQTDLDVYLELLNLARPLPLGTPVIFSAYGLLKALRRPTGNSQHKWLHSVLIRLRGGTVDMTDHRVRYFGGLIEGGFKDETTRHYEITINPKFAVLFGYGMWATIDREQRQALRQNVTAKALHAYYSTHAAPGGHSIETLAEIVGQKNSNRRQLKAQIIKAHDILKSNEIGFLKDYEVEKDIIRVSINHSPSQNRHIAGNIIKGRKKEKKIDTA